MGARGARPRPQPRATALPVHAAGAACFYPRGVGAPVVGAARMRVAARRCWAAAGERRRSQPVLDLAEAEQPSRWPLRA